MREGLVRVGADRNADLSVSERVGADRSEREVSAKLGADRSERVSADRSVRVLKSKREQAALMGVCERAVRNC